MKRVKEFIKFIKELSKTEKGRRILFFGGYFFFFLILAVIFRIGGSSRIPTSSEYEKGNPYSFSLNHLIDNNYSFEYKITLDGTLYNYVGKRYDSNQEFKYNNQNYFCNSSNCFINNNNLWVKSENPYRYSYFLDGVNIDKILKNATFVSKTDYESGKVSYSFLISSNTLNSMIKNINTDIDEEPNEIVVNSDESGKINEIKFDLNSYCINNKECNSNLEIELYYDSFGKIEEIKSPIQ